MAASRLRRGVPGLALALVLAPALVAPAAAAVYKWVDDNGVTQYSQTPPPGRQAVRLEGGLPTGGSTGASMESRLKALQESGKKDDEGDAKKGNEAQDPAQQAALEENCRQARESLTTLTEHRRILAKNEEGEMTRLTEEERQARVQELRDYIDEHCADKGG